MRDVIDAAKVLTVIGMIAAGGFILSQFVVSAVHISDWSAEVARQAAANDVCEQGAGPGYTADLGPMGSPGYITNIIDVMCLDAGTTITANGAVAIDCTCSAATLFGNEAVVPLTGKSSTTFNAQTNSVTCRSQASTVCDCWALTISDPDWKCFWKRAHTQVSSWC